MKLLEVLSRGGSLLCGKRCVCECERHARVCREPRALEDLHQGVFGKPVHSPRAILVLGVIKLHSSHPDALESVSIAPNEASLRPRGDGALLTPMGRETPTDHVRCNAKGQETPDTTLKSFGVGDVASMRQEVTELGIKVALREDCVWVSEGLCNRSDLPTDRLQSLSRDSGSPGTRPALQPVVMNRQRLELLGLQAVELSKSDGTRGGTKPGKELRHQTPPARSKQHEPRTGREPVVPDEPLPPATAPASSASCGPRPRASRPRSPRDLRRRSRPPP